MNKTKCISLFIIVTIILLSTVVVEASEQTTKKESIFDIIHNFIFNKPKVETLWWFDDTHNYCQKSSFSGDYLYKGLKTFETKLVCTYNLKASQNTKNNNIQSTKSIKISTTTHTPKVKILWLYDNLHKKCRQSIIGGNSKSKIFETKSECLSYLNDDINKDIVEQYTYPKPDYQPLLREYKIDKSYDIWKAQDPSSYITPENEWVKYYASKLFINKNGVLLYKIKEPYPVVSRTSFVNNYITDDEMFKYPPNADYWVNSDYYLVNGMKGDCEDFAITIASMFLSGETSILKDDTFVKQKIQSKVVMGYYKNVRHTWVEYEVYGDTYIASSDGNYYVSNIKQGSITDYIKKAEIEDKVNPIFEFTDKYFKKIN